VLELKACPHAGHDSGVNVVQGGIQNLEIGRDRPPGGNGLVVIEFPTLFAAIPADHSRKHIGVFHIVITKPELVVLASWNNAFAANTNTIKLLDQIGVLIGNADPSKETEATTIFATYQVLIKVVL
jgi:hypothetical protein